MSDRVSSQDITNLTAAVRDLALALRPATAETESRLGDWELLGEEFTDWRAAANPDCQAVGRRHLEEGPGPLPGYCLDLSPSEAFRKVSVQVLRFVPIVHSSLDALPTKQSSVVALTVPRLLFRVFMCAIGSS